MCTKTRQHKVLNMYILSLCRPDTGFSPCRVVRSLGYSWDLWLYEYATWIFKIRRVRRFWDDSSGRSIGGWFPRGKKLCGSLTEGAKSVWVHRRECTPPSWALDSAVSGLFACWGGVGFEALVLLHG